METQFTIDFCFFIWKRFASHLDGNPANVFFYFTWTLDFSCVIQLYLIMDSTNQFLLQNFMKNKVLSTYFFKFLATSTLWKKFDDNLKNKEFFCKCKKRVHDHLQSTVFWSELSTLMFMAGSNFTKGNKRQNKMEKEQHTFLPSNLLIPEWTK